MVKSNIWFGLITVPVSRPGDPSCRVQSMVLVKVDFG